MYMRTTVQVRDVPTGVHTTEPGMINEILSTDKLLSPELFCFVSLIFLHFLTQYYTLFVKFSTFNQQAHI